MSPSPAVATEVGAPSSSHVLESGKSWAEGVWHAVAVTLPWPLGFTVHPEPNIAIFNGRHYARVEVHDNKPRPTLGDTKRATAEQLRSAWGPFAAEGGNYDATRDTLTLRPFVAKNPGATTTGSFTTYSVRREGNAVILKQMRDQAGPISRGVTVKLERLE